MDNLIFSLNATVPLFLIMTLGYLFKKIKLVNPPFITTLNSLNYRVTLPILLFTDIAKSDFIKMWDTKYVMYCFLVTLFSILIIYLFARLFCKDRSILGEFIQGSYRSSAAVLGIAFMQNIYGHAGMAPLMIIATVPLYNVAAVLILSFTSPNRQSDHTTGVPWALVRTTMFQVITNPIILGILFGIIASLLPIHMGPILNKTLSSIAATASPLALLALGASFEGKKALAKIKPTLLASIIKLVLLPAIFLPLAVYLGFTDEKLMAILIMLGSPTTASCYIMAKNLDHEGTLTSSIVVTTTCLSSFTLTLYLFILKMMGL